MKNFSSKLIALILFMRKKYLFTIINFLFFVNILSAQVVVERTIGSPQNSVQIEPNFDKENYVLHSDENDQKVYVGEDLMDSSHYSESVNEEVTLTINLDFDPNEYFPRAIYAVDESGYMNFGSWTGENPITITLPAGQYDLFCYTMLTGIGINSYVVKEQIDIQEDIEMTIDPSEAQNYIQINLFDEEGNDLKPEEWGDGTRAISSFDQHFYFHPAELSVFHTYSIWYGANSSGEDAWNFYINDVSERYSFLQSIHAIRHDGVFYSSKYDIVNGISSSILLQNNPVDYVSDYEKFQPNIAAQSSGDYLAALKTMSVWNGQTLGGFQLVDVNHEMNLEEGIKVFLDNRLDETPFQLLVAPSIADYVDPSGTNTFLNTGNPIILDENGEVLFGSGASGMSSGGQLNWVNGTSVVLPFNSQFSFTKSEHPDIVQGDNAPLINVFALNYLSGNTKKTEIFIQPMGRYGEVRESDLPEMEIEIKYNDDIVYSGDGLGLKNFLRTWGYLGLADGVFDVMIISQNTEVDGLQGRSTAQIVYDWTREDWTSPSVQRLQFRNSEGKVTDRFESAEDGTVRVAAGDFEYDSTLATFNYQEGNNVEFYYSLYDQDTWTEIELTEYPEYFQMPAFGDYYEASLETVVVPEEDSWFDVKVICTDAAGNTQEQTISPAFKVAQATVGTEEFNKAEVMLYPNPFSDELNIRLSESIVRDYTVKVTDMTGKLIYQKEQNDQSFTWDGSSLTSGVYILSIENGDGVLFKKVIKK